MQIEYFRLIDRIVALDLAARTIEVEAIVPTESTIFEGHFPEFPVMPGVLIVEAIAQVGAVAMKAHPDNEGKLALLAGINSVRFKRQVKPGDTLRIEVEMGQVRRNIGTGSGVATVEGEVACKGDFMFALAPKSSLGL